MDVSFDGDVASGEALATVATRARELAEQRIVAAFRTYLHEHGPGPTDSDLQIFAKLAVVEHALQRDCLASLMSGSAPSVGSAKVLPAA